MRPTRQKAGGGAKQEVDKTPGEERGKTAFKASGKEVCRGEKPGMPGFAGCRLFAAAGLRNVSGFFKRAA